MTLIESEMHIEEIMSLERVGVVSTFMDIFGEQCSQLFPLWVDWRSLMILKQPLPLCKAGRVPANPLQSTKLLLVTELYLPGWTVGRPCQPITNDARDRIMSPVLGRPLSDFAALYSRRLILEKVTSFAHTHMDRSPLPLSPAV